MALIGYSLPDTLTDDAGNALKGVTVTVTGPASYSGVATSDPSTGLLRLGPLPVGDYVITLGSRSVTLPVIASGADIVAEAVALSPAPDLSDYLTEIAASSTYAAKASTLTPSLLHGAVARNRPPVVATRAGRPGPTAGQFGNTTDTQCGGRSLVTALTDCSGLRLRFINVNLGSSTSLTYADGGAMTVKAAVELAGNVIVPAFFNGAETASLPYGSYIDTDPISVAMLAGETFYNLFYATITAGKRFPTIVEYGGSGSDDRYASGTSVPDYTRLSGGSYPGFHATFAGNGFGVFVVLGSTSTSKPSIGVDNDSIGYGADDVADIAGGGGYVNRVAKRLGVGVQNLSKYGETQQGAILPVQTALRPQLHSTCTHIIAARDRNDVSGGRTLAQIQADNIKRWRQVRASGALVIAATTTPKSSGTFGTTAGQTTDATNAVLVTLNAWKRAGCPIDPTTKAQVAIGTSGALTCDVYDSTGTRVLTGNGDHPVVAVVDVAAAVESTPNSGIWKASHTADGTHPNAAGHAAMALAVPDSLFSLRAA